MKIKIPTIEEVEAITRQSLRDNFPLYEERHRVTSINRNHVVIVNYRTADPILRPDSTRFDAEVMDDCCILDYIHLEKRFRGEGYGWKLYEAVHNIAKLLGLKRVIQTPSGGFLVHGEIVKSREDYLLERGYRKISDTEVELIL